jgi:hypothetical protein
MIFQIFTDQNNLVNIAGHYRYLQRQKQKIFVKGHERKMQTKEKKEEDEKETRKQAAIMKKWLNK